MTHTQTQNRAPARLTGRQRNPATMDRSVTTPTSRSSRRSPLQAIEDVVVDVPAAVTATEVTKVFGSATVLDRVSLTIPQGMVYGLLGPNGAGKTTLIRILTTLLSPTSGRASVVGADVVSQAAEVRSRIGLAGQFAAVDGHLTGRENLVMVGRLYNLGRAEARRRADEVLERIHLTDAANQQVATYSGGMRRRLDLAASMVGRPPVLFLDEPTTGVDPRSRIDIWDLINDMVTDDGTTLLLTTQYLDEAELLADRIGVIDHGALIAEGTADELKDQMGGDRIEVAIDRNEIDSAMAALGWSEPGVSVDRRRGLIWAPAPDGTADLSRVLEQLRSTAIEPGAVGLRRPSLDDVFLTLTAPDADRPTRS